MPNEQHNSIGLHPRHANRLEAFERGLDDVARLTGVELEGSVGLTRAGLHHLGAAIHIDANAGQR